MKENFHFANRSDRLLFEIAILAALINRKLLRRYSASFNGLREFCFLRRIFHGNSLLPIEGDGYTILTRPKPYDIEIASPIYEPAERELFRPNPGDTVLDVGANIGSYTLMLANLVGKSGKVVAIEPNPKAFRILERNVSVNGTTNVILEPVACSDKSGMLDLHFGDNIGAASGEEGVHKAEVIPNVARVEMLPLDSLVDRLGLQRVDWVKIDTEGMERRVIDGAAETIRAHHPKLFIEIHKEEHRQYIEALLRGRGYSTKMLSVHTGTLFATPDSS
jgi:FkbM family methyltransferase